MILVQDAHRAYIVTKKNYFERGIAEAVTVLNRIFEQNL